MFEDILKCIEAYDTITIFRHIKPDGDAYGSQWGLASYLKYRYPDKKIYCLGTQAGRNKGLFPPMDEVDDDTIRKSLAIAVDTSTADRVDDQRIWLADKICKFDHHEGSEKYAAHEVVIDTQSSCAEIVTMFIESIEPVKNIPQQTAIYLYAGILSDTQNFTISSCSYESLLIASKLAETGLNMSRVNYLISRVSTNVYNMTTDFRTRMVFTDNHIGYAYCDKALMDKYHVSYNDCKDLVNEFNILDELESWVLFIEDTEEHPGMFNASLRSRGCIVNKVAEHFGGGGHRQAAGTRALSKEECEHLLVLLDGEVTRYYREEAN